MMCGTMIHIIIIIILLIRLPFAASLLTIQSQLPHNAADATVPKSAHTRTYYYAYGKGSDIWPECNEEPVRLAASFPGGVIPQPAMDLLELASSTAAATTLSETISDDEYDDDDAEPSVTSSLSYQSKGIKRRAVRTTLSHILRSAAQASTRRARSPSTIGKVYGETFGVPSPAISKGPSIIAMILLGTNCVNFYHIVSVTLLSIYIIGLASWCIAPKYSSSPNHPILNMPSFPSKGHIPSLISNPLGASLTNSRLYKTWLRLGAVLGVLFPIMVLAQLTLTSYSPLLTKSMGTINIGELKRIVGGHTFLLCWQALSESMSRAALLPLPIRILIPISYSVLRLSSLHSWASQSAMPMSIRLLGIVNLVFWYANLAFFLIPVGVIRYLRAHFYCVEAEEVTVREGGESSVGLLQIQHASTQQRRQFPD